MDIGSYVGIILVLACVVYYSLYFIVKKATKDALKEFYKDKEK